MGAVSAAIPVETTGWKTLFRIAGSVALIMVAFIPIQIAVFAIWPPPSTAAGWFELFQSNNLVGLIDMDLLLMVDQIFVGIMLIALYVVLRTTNLSLMTVGLALGLTGMVIYFSSTVAFEMMSLSHQYATAATASERTILLAAGQTMLVTWQGTAFNIGYVAEGVAFLIIASVMLGSTIFGKTTAWIGIVLGVMSLVPPTVAVVGMYFALGSLVPLVVWDILVARRLFQLANM
ncbi:MAG: hypothetical protein M1469_06555 [Bacteroidetes bacterium]|nr:hypothetical protein [Bacteroidota bacterium]